MKSVLVKTFGRYSHITGDTKCVRDQEGKSDFSLDVTENLLDNLM
jgi:hypothetical protein